jgi:polar amino acid transport system ATP-binding protein
VVFMDGGVVVEEGPPSQVISAPAHERTRAFLSRVLDPAATRVEGSVPSDKFGTDGTNA